MKWMGVFYRYLGFLNGGKRISVQVDRQSHVALLDNVNLQRYIHRQTYRNYGGLQSYREERYRIPYRSEWHLVIYNNSSPGQARAEVYIR